jgi:XTP/dITP diphosphohydrolase
VTEVVLASGNRGKLRELAQVLSARGLRLRAQSEFGIEGPPETAVTFVENALAKARHATRITGLPAIADDSGLEVEMLAGAPGVYSARFAGPEADDAANNARLLRDLEGVPAGQRQARFRAVIVYLRHADDPAPIIAEGTWTGEVALQATGEHGFGYDPLFLLPDGRSAAELEAEEKNRISHRGQALQVLAEKLAS